MRHIRALMMLLALGVIILSSALPAGAHISAYTGPVPPVYPIPPDRGSGSALAQVTVSPDLPVFPCGAAAVLPRDAITLYDTTQPNPDWDSDRYHPCYGDLYAAAEGAINEGISGGAGVWHGSNGPGPDDLPYAWTSTFPGSVTANYTYSEPCQDPDGPGGLDPEAVTGEAIGWINITGPAAGAIGTTTISSVSFKVKFWWSRIGTDADIGLDDPIIDFNGAAAPAPFAITKFNGRGNATFIPTIIPDCTAPTHTHPNDIIVEAGAGGSGNGVIK